MTRSNFVLPDDPTPAGQNPPERPRRSWSSEDVDTLLSSPDLAEWAAQWLGELRTRLGEEFPRLLAAGLGFDPEAHSAGSLILPAWMSRRAPDAIWLRQYLARSDLAAAWFEHGFLTEDPGWLYRLLHYERAQVARSFLLNGNVNDYTFDPVHGYRPAVRLLVDTLLQVKDCVLTYRLSQGLALHAPEESRDAILERLPASIRDLLDAPGFCADGSLLSQLCSLFDTLRQWLTGTTDGEQDCYAFTRGVAILFENVHLLIPPDRSDVERNFLVDNLLHWSISPELFRSSHCLILTAETLEDVGNELRARGGKIERIAIPRPDSLESRLKFLMPLLDPTSRMVETRVARLPIGRGWLQSYGDGRYLDRLERLSRDTAGLSLIGIEDLLQQVSSRPGGLERAAVMELKRERLRQESEGLLEVVDPRRTLRDIGGYTSLKTRLAEVITALQSASDPLVRSTIPMGILFFGPPGTGKSITAEALAGESDISLAKLGDFRGMYVGESERNLSRILGLIEALHPVIVFIDEIDQALGSRGASSGDGGVDNRIFGRLLEFMSDTTHRGKILWIGAANYPNKVDAAMKRAGRFDLVLPFLLPDPASRGEILALILNGKLKGVEDIEVRLEERDFERLAAATEGFSGAELAALVGETLRRAAHSALRAGESERRKAVIDAALFDQVLSVYRPPPGVRESYLEMERLAVQEVNFRDMLPERYRDSDTGTPPGKHEP